MPVKRQKDPAKIIEINARNFEVKEFYIDKMCKYFKDMGIRFS